MKFTLAHKVDHTSKTKEQLEKQQAECSVPVWEDQITELQHYYSETQRRKKIISVVSGQNLGSLSGLEEVLTELLFTNFYWFNIILTNPQM